MRQHLPSLNALKAFEAAARHESFTRAAEELCVTQGAVSHQVKALEAELSVKLFNRERQRLIITEAGRDYLAVVRDALDRIAAGTERLLQRQSTGVLTVSTSPDFAAKWLVHRLGHFAEAHSEIDLRVSAALHHVDFAREDVDLAVRHGDGNWPGLDAVRLSAERLFAVCSPKLLLGRRRIDSIADILKFPLIHLDSRSDWANWLRGVGIDDTAVTHGPVLNRASMVIDAAINGQGIALARTTLAAWDLINGRLVLPFPESLPVSKTYWIVCPKVTAALPKIATFRDWLLAEAATDQQQLKKLTAQPDDRNPVRANRSDGPRRRRGRPESLGDHRRK
ncbi:transcriptional regulator GcvA [Bradyrhizobium iriomotense]|uniref:Transcriptional regulator n=1 Tax=Bradyrhizobium iriomotense TaxID=441950 RepID=A0ABQ6AQJ7_9BRAD|nr:transcriptional regulator GcvA [Bradyrhizobium iriomotense]GLR84245.1 transcriptional regulator [Bradyrhizobium iriomotense]